MSLFPSKFIFAPELLIPGQKPIGPVRVRNHRHNHNAFAFWPFLDCGSRLNDYWGNAHGEITGAHWERAFGEKWLKFDADGEGVECGSHNIASGTISIIARAYLTDVSTTAFHALIGKRDEAETNKAVFAVERHGNLGQTDELRVYFNVGGAWSIWVTTDASLVVNAPFWLTITYDAATDPSVKLDGRALSLTRTFGSGYPSLPVNNAAWTIGDLTVLANSWPGGINYLRIFDGVLSDAILTDIVKNPYTGLCPIGSEYLTFSDAAPSVFNPFWASSSTRIIQPGMQA